VIFLSLKIMILYLLLSYQYRSLIATASISILEFLGKPATAKQALAGYFPASKYEE